MRNLIRAEFYRFKKTRLSLLLLAATFLCGIIFGINSIFYDSFDDMYVIPLSVFQAIFLSLLIGQEYSDGTIRNKIVSGYTRLEIYGSKSVLAVIISLISTTAYLIPAVMLSAFVLWNAVKVTFLLCILLGFYLLNLVWAQLFVFVSLLISRREISVIINLILVIAILLGAYQIESALGQPEISLTDAYTSVEMTPEEVEQVQNGTFNGSYSTNIDDNSIITYYKDVLDYSEATENPRYVKQPWRTILIVIDSALPNGQVNLYEEYLNDVYYTYELGMIADFDDSNYNSIYTYPLYSLAVIAIVTVIGFVMFRKKDFK